MTSTLSETQHFHHNQHQYHRILESNENDNKTLSSPNHHQQKQQQQNHQDNELSSSNGSSVVRQQEQQQHSPLENKNNENDNSNKLSDESESLLLFRINHNNNHNHNHNNECRQQHDSTTLSLSDGDHYDDDNDDDACSSSTPPPPTNNTLSFYSTISLFSICTMLLFADQNLMAPNLTAIANDFHIYDPIERDVKLGGNIAFAFFMIGAPASILFGYLTDHDYYHTTFHKKKQNCFYYNKYRIILFTITILIGEISCFLTGFVTNYTQFFILRSMTGFGMGGAFPILYSLLSDWYSSNYRHIVNAMIGIGMGAGIALGQVIAGIIGPIYGWRIPFIIVSTPAIIIVLIICIFVNDPIRGGMEEENIIKNNGGNNSNNDDVEQQEQQEQQQEKEQQVQRLIEESHDDFIENKSNHLNNQGYNDDIDHQSNNRTIMRFNMRSSSDNLEMTTLNHDDDDDDDDDEIGIRKMSNSSNSSNSSNNSNMIDDKQQFDVVASSTKHKESNWKDTYYTLFTTPTVILALLQGGPGCIPWGIVNTYLNDYLSTDIGLSIQHSTFIILLFGIGVFLGQIIGGVFGSFLYRKNHRYPAILAGVSAIIGTIPFYMLIHFNHYKYGTWLYMPIAITAGIGSGITGPIIKATLQNVTLPNHRGQAFALFNVTDDFGRGLGPVFVAGMIRMTGSRSKAFSIGTLGWIVCGILNLAIYFFVAKDESHNTTTTPHANDTHDHRQDQDQDSTINPTSAIPSSSTPATDMVSSSSSSLNLLHHSHHTEHTNEDRAVSSTLSIT